MTIYNGSGALDTGAQCAHNTRVIRAMAARALAGLGAEMNGHYEPIHAGALAASWSWAGRTGNSRYPFKIEFVTYVTNLRRLSDAALRV